MLESPFLIWMPGMGVGNTDEARGTLILMGQKTRWHVLRELCYSRAELD